MGLKLIHAADLHLDSPFASFDGAQRALLQRAQGELPEKISRCVKTQGAQMLLLAGDVFDGPYRRETARLLADCLEDTGVPVFISPGNHDFLGPDSPWDRESWPENVYIFRGGLRYVDVEALSCRVYGGGYSAMDCPGLLENFRAEGDQSYTVGLLHGDPTQARSPYCPVTASQVERSGLQYLALGHVHQGGSFRAGETLCAWPGCPMGRGWDETGTKGILRVELGERVRLTPIQLGVPRFFTETVDISGGCEEALKGALPAMETQDFYRVTLTGRGEPDCEELRKTFAHIKNLEFRDRTRPKEDLWSWAGQDSFRGTYFGLLKEKSEEDREAATLAAQLSRKILEGEEVTLP